MNRRGFTLLELSVSLGILGLIVSGAVLLIASEADSTRQSETVETLKTLKRAMIGDSRVVTKESRTDFGYVCDMGSLPVALTDLWTRGSKPAFAYDNTKKAGAGWAGPYIEVGLLGFSDDLALDSWGNGIVYTVGIGTSGLTGQQYQARISSLGPDAADGTADDLTVEIYTTEIFSRVVSY